MSEVAEAPLPDIIGRDQAPRLKAKKNKTTPDFRREASKGFLQRAFKAFKRGDKSKYNQLVEQSKKLVSSAANEDSEAV